MLHQILNIFQFTCLKLIVNYCIKHGALYVNDLYIHWAMIYILSWTTKKHQKILSRLLHSKLKKIQALFKDLHRNLRTFQGKMEFKVFSRTFQDCANPGLGGFSTFMQTLDFVSGLHKCLKFSQALSCLYQAMQTRKTFSIA